MADAWTILPTIINSRTHAGKRRKNNSPLMKCHRGTPGTRKLGNSEFPDVVGGEGGSGGHGGAGDPPRLGQEGKRKLTESAREFPKAFRLAESVRVAPGGAGALAGPHHLRTSLPRHSEYSNWLFVEGRPDISAYGHKKG